MGSARFDLDSRWKCNFAITSIRSHPGNGIPFYKSKRDSDIGYSPSFYKNGHTFFCNKSTKIIVNINLIAV